MYDSFRHYVSENTMGINTLSPDDWIILGEKYAIYKCKEVCEGVIETVKNDIKNNN